MLEVDAVPEGEFWSSGRRRFKKEDWSIGGRAKSTGKLGISHPAPGPICERALLIFTSWTSRRSTLGWIKTAVKSTAKNNSTIFASVFERFTGFRPISRRAPRVSLGTISSTFRPQVKQEILSRVDKRPFLGG